MMNRRNIANAYNAIAVETGVLSATPYRLTQMLFENAIQSVTTAKAQVLAGDRAGKGASISRAVGIIGSGLRANLNFDEGGDIAKQLEQLYAYMVDCLMVANLRNTTAPLDETLRLLNELKSAWDQIPQPIANMGAAA